MILRAANEAATSPTDSSVAPNGTQRCAIPHHAIRQRPVAIQPGMAVVRRGRAVDNAGATHKRCTQCCKSNEVLPVSAFKLAAPSSAYTWRAWCGACESAYNRSAHVRRKAGISPRREAAEAARAEAEARPIHRAMRDWRRPASAGRAAAVDPLRAAL